MTLIQSIQHPSRIQDVRFCRHPHDLDSPEAEELLFVSAEDKKVSVYAQMHTFTKTKANNVNSDDDEDSDTNDQSHENEAYSVYAELIGHANRYVDNNHFWSDKVSYVYSLFYR